MSSGNRSASFHLSDSVSCILVSNMPEQEKIAVLTNVINYIDYNIAQYQTLGYKVPSTVLMQNKNKEPKRIGVEALMTLSQQPAKSE